MLADHMVLGRLSFPAGGAQCYDPAAPMTDREIIEWLRRLEEGQMALRNEWAAVLRSFGLM